MVQSTLAESPPLGCDEVLAEGGCNKIGEDGEGTEAGKRLGNRDVSQPGLLVAAGVEIMFVGSVETIVSEILNELLKEIGEGTCGESREILARVGATSGIGVKPDTNALCEREEFQPRHTGLVFTDDLPFERRKKVSEFV